MGNYLKILQIAIGLVPMIIETVKAIETPGNGAEKAATVIAIVRTAMDELLPDDVRKAIGVDKLEGFIGKVIGIVVAFLNKVGAFQTGTSQPSA